MKIKATMLESAQGVDDGDVYPKQFLVGETYEIGQDLFETFKGAGLVTLEGGSKKPAKGADVQMSDAEKQETIKVLDAKLREMEYDDLMKYAKKEHGVKFKGKPDTEEVIEATLTAYIEALG